MATLYHRKRFLQGLFVALRILISYKLANILVIFLSQEGKSSFMKRLHTRNASLIRENALRMKGVMIKVGQFLSSRIDLLPDEYIQELSRLQDRVPPHDYQEIRQQICNELGNYPEEVFSYFDAEPIAAASLGQVHHAICKDDRHVAVKVQYPGIGEIIETDIRMFSVLVNIMHGRHGNINLRVLHEEFSKIIRAELDYIQEGKNADRFRENFQGDDRVIIPKVIWELTKKKLLTLEYVEGIKINDCPSVRASGLDCKETVNLLARTYAKMIFIHGFFHGDPHPGNIFVTQGPALVFVDFGMVQAIPDSIRKDLRSFSRHIVERDPAGIIESMRRMGFMLEGADYEAMNRATKYLIEKYRDITPSELKSVTIDDIGEDISNVIGIIDSVQIPNNFILLGRTIGMLNGIAFSLNPDANMIEIVTPYVREFFQGGKGENTTQILMEIREKIHALWDMPVEVHEFISKANRGELSIRLAKSEVQQITGQFRTMTNVMMLMVLSVTVAASALFFLLMDAKTVAIAAAGVSVVLGLLSVFRLMKT